MTSWRSVSDSTVWIYNPRVKEILGILAVLCEVASAIVYYRDIYRGNTKPHIYTMLVWSIVTGIAFAGTMVAGAQAGAWGTAASFLFVASLVPISLYWGTTDITWHDKVFLGAALFAVVPWIITKDPLWSVIFATIIDACGMIPTLRKTWNEPESESLHAWILAGTRGFLQILALHVYSTTTLIYLVEVLITDSILVGIIVWRGRAKKKADMIH